MTMLNINGREFELIDFNRRITNKGETVTGIMLARSYLAVADNYRIYNTRSGEPLIKGRFSSIELCMKFATMLEKTYKEYFDLWDAYPDADLLSWTKYSVDDGVMIFEIAEYLDTLDVITQADINKGIDIAQERSKRWKMS